MLDRFCADVGARLQDRAAIVTRPAAVLVARFQNVAAESTNRLLRRHSQQACRLRIEVAYDPVLIDGVDTLNNPTEHGLRFSLSATQGACQVDEVASHIFHRSCERTHLSGATNRNGRREVSLAKTHGRLGK